ncbi:MAG: hypothetical protein IJL12_09250 [Selenomonadaceae bacterium]|nr:hypothetical protein [Selenomonadaceae bacterium]
MSKLKILYGDIDCGYVDFKFIKDGKTFKFAFDELLSDPFPQLVNLFVHVQRGEACKEEFGDTHDNRIIVLKIFVQPDGDKVILRAELIKEKILLEEIYPREELLVMFKKIFDDLLNDKYFPYSYPCFLYLCCADDDLGGNVMDAIEDAHPGWEMVDVCNYVIEAGQLKLAPRYKKYLAHYKKMLTDYVILDKWFE